MINGISFTGRETMLTAGLKEGKKAHKFFKGDAPTEMGNTVVKEVKQLKNEGVSAFIPDSQPILTSPLAKDSAVTGENIHFFG